MPLYPIYESDTAPDDEIEFGIDPIENNGPFADIPLDQFPGHIYVPAEVPLDIKCLTFVQTGDLFL